MLLYKKTILSFILALFLTCILNAQDLKIKDTTSIGLLLKHDFKHTTKGIGHAFTRPIYWKGKDYAKFGGLIVGTLALSSLDDETNHFFKQQEKDFPKIVRDFGWYFGSPQNYFMANAGLYGFGLLTKNESVRKTSVLIISSTVTSGLIISIMKNGFGRARPGANLGNHDFDPFSKAASHHSFPSGHTVLSVTMAHAVAKQFDNTWTKIGIYSIGAIPPISRLIDNAHWLTDIAFGAAISIIVVDSIDKFLFNSKAYSYPEKTKKISWSFTFNANQIGVIGSF